MLDQSNSKKTQTWMREIMKCSNQDEIDSLGEHIMEECAKDEPPFLSDLILNIDKGGQAIMIALGEREVREAQMSDPDRFRWKIQVLCDEWGNKPQQGDVVTRVANKNLYKRAGIPTSSKEISRSKIDGSYSKRFEDRYDYVVDDKGCVECGFTAAGYFLNVYGVHAVTKYSLTTKPELSGGPSKAPNGDMIHVHYWRYKEMDAAAYEALSEIEKSDDPKRGLSKK